MRLDRIIAAAGTASRSEARKLISAGRVTIGGRAVTETGFRADPAVSAVCLDGRPVGGAGKCYIMCNKPAGVLSGAESGSQKSVIDLLPARYAGLGLFPAGRLDKDTTGLLILTNDGDFCHEIITPRKHVAKRYAFAVNGKLDKEDAAAFADGMVLRDGTKCLPAVLEVADSDASRGFVTLFEGRYHQVKRMLAARGKPVRALERVSVGGLELDPALTPGAFRELTENDRNKIFNRNVTK
jgi:16S rRNA pseudouridine516 synthase